jgi:hypothetical protein
MPNQNEETIILPEVTNEEANQLLSGAPYAIGNLSKAVPQFTTVETYTTFKAEYALVDGNLIIHFFETPEHPVDRTASSANYWQLIFPQMLNEIGQTYFQATAPRLVAKYTEELKSWFFKAQNYEHILDLEHFVLGFFEALDRALENALSTPMPSS